jgi:hypothetical protein
LTGWDVDILTQEEFTKGMETMYATIQTIPGITEQHADKLAAMGMVSVFDIEEVGADVLVSELTIDEATATTVVETCSTKAKEVSEQQAKDKIEKERKAREEAQQLGLALTGPQGRAVEEMNDSFTRVYYAILGIIQQVTARLAPAITGIATKFTDFVKGAGGESLGKSIVNAIIEGAKVLAAVADSVANQFRRLYQDIAGALGIATTAEGRKLQQMQRQIKDGTAPTIKLPGQLVTDPAFKAEVARLEKIVAKQPKQQIEDSFPLSEFVANAEKAIVKLGNMADDTPPPLPAPKPTPTLRWARP